MFFIHNLKRNIIFIKKMYVSNYSFLPITSELEKTININRCLKRNFVLTFSHDIR